MGRPVKQADDTEKSRHDSVVNDHPALISGGSQYTHPLGERRIGKRLAQDTKRVGITQISQFGEQTVHVDNAVFGGRFKMGGICCCHADFSFCHVRHALLQVHHPKGMPGRYPKRRMSRKVPPESAVVVGKRN